MGFFDIFKNAQNKNQGRKAIKLVYDNTSVIGNRRHAANQFIYNRAVFRL